MSQLIKLSIITVTYNNREGLESTVNSIARQSYQDFEWIVIDGGSSDGSIDVIKTSVAKLEEANVSCSWVSERDTGIYNAMNKGIRKAQGEYIMFLNSGDCLIDEDVLSRVFSYDFEEDVVHGNVIFNFPDHQEIRNTTEEITLRTFVERTINHSGCALIRRDAFNRWGLYDENLQIVSDWKWFLQVLGIGTASSRYIDVTMSLFDSTGISSTQHELLMSEREKVLKEEIPQRILSDYKKFSSFEDELYAQELKIRNSLSYRIGSFVLIPVRLCRKLIKK